jgi:hypothetical protein
MYENQSLAEINPQLSPPTSSRRRALLVQPTAGKARTVVGTNLNNLRIRRPLRKYYEQQGKEH